MGPSELSGGSGYRTTTVAGAADGRKKSEH